MPKTCLLLLLLLSYAVNVHSQQWPPTLSENAQISLLTVSPGTKLYSAFGHSALRVSDPEQHFDMVFNYGAFYFDQTFKFYRQFLQGKLDYMLSVSPYERFLEEYSHYNRSVVQQYLQLNEEQKDSIYRFLLINNRPENRTYKYDFFYNNCSTRIRDIFERELRGDINFYPDGNTFSKTYRDLVQEYTTIKPWINLGITLILGYPADKQATGRGYMFLPDYLMFALDSAMVTEGGKYLPLVKQKETVLEGKINKASTSWFVQPTTVLWIILLPLLIASIRDIVQQHATKWIDHLVYSIAGLVGLLLSLCWLLTDHFVLSWNLNLVWAFPGHLIMVFLIANATTKNWIRQYFLISSLLALLILLSWPRLPQPLPPALIPFITLLVLRGIVIYRRAIEQAPSTRTMTK